MNTIEQIAQIIATGDANATAQALLETYGADASDQAHEFASGMDNAQFWRDVQTLLRLEAQSDEPAPEYDDDDPSPEYDDSWFDGVDHIAY